MLIVSSLQFTNLHNQTPCAGCLHRCTIKRRTFNQNSTEGVNIFFTLHLGTKSRFTFLRNWGFSVMDRILKNYVNSVIMSENIDLLILRRRVLVLYYYL